MSADLWPSRFDAGDFASILRAMIARLISLVLGAGTF
jgi:hypothetical protein